MWGIAVVACHDHTAARLSFGLLIEHIYLLASLLTQLLDIEVAGTCSDQLHASADHCMQYVVPHLRYVAERHDPSTLDRWHCGGSGCEITFANVWQ